MFFLEKLLPSEGLYCVAMLLPGGGFRHFFHDNLPAAGTQLTALNNAGHTVYIAQATYDPEAIALAEQHNKTLPYGSPKTDRKKQRSQDNALYLKNFFLDIDVGEKWPLKSQREGMDAVRKLMAETSLPHPTIVSSGNGLYAHWILTEAVPAQQWRTIAYLLKKVVAKYSPALGGDASRTSDSASVLRAPGTNNRKPGREEKPVLLLKDTEPIKLMDFVDILNAAARKAHINHDSTQAPKASTDINSEFFSGLERESTPGNAEKIADQCAQLGLMRSTGGDVIEPLWYACIGVLMHCADGESITHQWSSGHAEYNQRQTNDKIQQWRAAGVGPSTCANLGESNPQACVGCKHNGKIKSPIVLGRPEPEAREIPEEQCTAPDGFRRGEGGLYAEEEGRWIRFYDCDLYPDRLAYDESLGYEVMTIKHHLPHEGAMECTLRSSIVNDPKALLTTLSDNHIKVVGMKEKKYMTAYLESYSARLQRQRRMSKLMCQMGWKESRNGSPIFVLGKKIFHTDGTVEDASLARNVPKAVEGYHAKGSMEAWVGATRILNEPGMEPFAFSLLSGGFGAPLVKETGFDGALVSLVGESGAGKTLMLRWIQSVWGYHNDLMMLRDDTKNAMVSRLGVCGNLPMTIDEITNIDGMELSDLVYRITQGRDKARLTKNSEERRLLNHWNTLAVTSSNSSLVDKLSGAKHDASAEINRVFEYPVNEHDLFKGPVTTSLYWTLHENYGHAGEVYAKWLVQNFDKIKPGLDKIKARIDIEAEIKGDERFWSAIASAAIYGGLVAKQLGLIDFEIAPVMKWASETIWNMRGDKQDLAGDSVGILGQFLDAYSNNCLIVRGDARSPSGSFIVELPRGPLVTRYELDTQRLYVSRQVFKEWITKRFGSYTKIKNDLTAMHALLDASRKKTLGAGTHLGGVQQVTWEINMRCPKLGKAAQQLIQTAEALSRDPLQKEGK